MAIEDEGVTEFDIARKRLRKSAVREANNVSKVCSGERRNLVEVRAEVLY